MPLRRLLASLAGVHAWFPWVLDHGDASAAANDVGAAGGGDHPDGGDGLASPTVGAVEVALYFKKRRRERVRKPRLPAVEDNEAALARHVLLLLRRRGRRGEQRSHRGRRAGGDRDAARAIRRGSGGGGWR